MNWIHFD